MIFSDGICKNHTGKMEGLQSFSTSCLCNARCLARMENGNSICSHCFSNTMLKCYKKLASKLERNTELVTTTLLKMDELPIFNVAFFRLESFGDLQNLTQAQNYIRLCKRNSSTTFALWTKNPDILQHAFTASTAYRKPKNMIVIYSSPEINTPDTAMLDRYPFIDKLFTVFTKDYATAHNVPINCGKRKCLECQHCYHKKGNKFINELLK